MIFARLNHSLGNDRGTLHEDVFIQCARWHLLEYILVNPYLYSDIDVILHLPLKYIN